MLAKKAYVLDYTYLYIFFKYMNNYLDRIEEAKLKKQKIPPIKDDVEEITNEVYDLLFNCQDPVYFINEKGETIGKLNRNDADNADILDSNRIIDWLFSKERVNEILKTGETSYELSDNYLSTIYDIEISNLFNT